MTPRVDTAGTTPLTVWVVRELKEACNTVVARAWAMESLIEVHGCPSAHLASNAHFMAVRRVLVMDSDIESSITESLLRASLVLGALTSWVLVYGGACKRGLGTTVALAVVSWLILRRQLRRFAQCQLQRTIYSMVVDSCSLVVLLRRLAEVQLTLSGRPLSVGSDASSPSRHLTHMDGSLRGVIDLVCARILVKQKASTQPSLRLLATWVGTWASERLQDAAPVATVLHGGWREWRAWPKALRGALRLLTNRSAHAAVREACQKLDQRAAADTTTASEMRAPGFKIADVEASVAQLNAVVYLWKHSDAAVMSSTSSCTFSALDVVNAARRVVSVAQRHVAPVNFKGRKSVDPTVAGDVLQEAAVTDETNLKRRSPCDEVAATIGCDQVDTADPRQALPRRKIPALPTVLLQRRLASPSAAVDSPPHHASGVEEELSLRTGAAFSRRRAVREELTDLFRFREMGKRWATFK